MNAVVSSAVGAVAHRNHPMIAFFSTANANKKRMLKFFRPLLILHWKILVKFDEATYFPTSDTPKATSELPDATDPFLAPRSVKACSHEMFACVHFLKSDMVFRILNPFQ